MTDPIATLALEALAAKRARAAAVASAQRQEDERMAARILASYVPLVDDQLAATLGGTLPLAWQWDRPWRVEGDSIMAASSGPLGLEAPWGRWRVRATLATYADDTTTVYFSLADTQGNSLGFTDLASLGEALEHFGATVGLDDPAGGSLYPH